jgi:putative oxidoreductase
VSGLLRSPRLHLLLRLLLGGFFVYASLDKIASPAAFAKIIYQWQIGGPVAANLVAVTLPWIELVAGLLLIAGVWRREAALVIALLLVVFLVAAASVLARGIDVENCGCVSVAKASPPSAWPPAWTKGVGWFLVTRNLVLLGVALALVRVAPAPGRPAS